MIPQAFIQDLLNRLDIVDVVGRYVPLKRAGANYKACCPFHNEKTPSFSVSPTKQFYHCFGCGAHGTAISFLMEHQGLGFVEAVEELARGLGMTVPREASGAPRESARDEGLTEALTQAARFYRERLKGADNAIAYLKGRGLTGEIAARFGLGYAPDDWQGLAAVFPEYEKDGRLARAGLVIDNENGRRYDRFRDRVMFPILSQRGEVIGFGGRVLGKGEPKYLNSPETAVFEKGRELYGLFQARQAIRQAGRVLVVEGYMDVVALAQFGVEYAVATLGTATTPEHVKKLLRHTDEVVFCFDGDEAGRRAAWRALENSLELLADDKRLSFLFLPQGEDPDTFVRQVGREAFEARLGEALPLSQFLVQELAGRVDMRTEEGRARFLQMAAGLLERVAAPALGMLLRRRVAELAGVSPQEMGGMMRRRPTEERGGEPPARPAPPPRRPGPLSLERRLLEMVLAQPTLARGFDLSLVEGGRGEAAALVEAVGFFQAHPQAASVAALLHGLEDSPVLALLREAARSERWEGFGTEELGAEFAAAQDKLRGEREKEGVKRQREALLGKRLQDLTPEERRLVAAAPR